MTGARESLLDSPWLEVQVCMRKEGGLHVRVILFYFIFLFLSLIDVALHVAS